MEAGDEDLLHLAGNVLDNAQEFRLGLVHVAALLGEELIAGVDPLVFVDGAQVRGAQGVDLSPQLGRLPASLGQALHRLAQPLGRAVAQLVAVPQLVQDLFFLHLGGQLLLLDPGGAPLEIQNLAVAGLRVLLGPGALSLQLQLGLADGADFLPDGGGLLMDERELVFLFPQPRLKAFDL